MKKNETLLKEFRKAAEAMRDRLSYYAENNETPIDDEKARSIATGTMRVVNEVLGNGYFNYALQMVIGKNLDWPKLID